MTTRNSHVSNSSTIQQSGLFRRKPWLIVICAIAVVISLLLVGAWLIIPNIMGDLTPTPGWQCQLSSIEPAPDTVFSYAHVQEGVPFSVTVQLVWTGLQSHTLIQTSVPATENSEQSRKPTIPPHYNVLQTSVLALKSNTRNMFGSEDVLANIGGVEERKCSLDCQVTVQGTLYPEAIDQGKITLLVDTLLIESTTWMAVVSGCGWMSIEYPVSEAP